jgi:coenzyme F420 hydrogenase subunit beta
MLARQRPALGEKLGLILTFFCAGTPNTQGTLNLLETLEVEPDEVQTLRYRGEGWPGRFSVVPKTGGAVRGFSYEDSWDHLNHYRPFRCHLCPDGLGRLADIACGDAWHRYAGDGDPGRSIVLVRTAKGQEILRRAVAAGYVELRPLAPSAVLEAQRNLLERRRLIFGRLLGMRLLGVPTPRFKGFSLLRSWLRLSPAMMVRTVAGTMRRLLARRLWRRRPHGPGGGGPAADQPPERVYEREVSR